MAMLGFLALLLLESAPVLAQEEVYEQCTDSLSVDQ